MKEKILPNGSTIRREVGNTWTHLVGTVFAVSCIWMVWPAVRLGWQWAFGTIFFIAGMFLMFLSSTLYHWVWPGRVKRVLRILDHINIYVMIACSYTPICVVVVGGALGWTVFGLLWAVVIGGTFYKIFALDRWPKLSLGLYLVMGWSGLLIARPIVESISWRPLCLILLEGILYSTGTWFFAHDGRRHYHAIWHIFVMAGAMAHWSAILLIILESL